MSNLSDSKPRACGGWVLRRTDSHIIGKSEVKVSNSGDRMLAPPIRNFALTTTPDSDPRWGNVFCEEVEPPIEPPVPTPTYGFQDGTSYEFQDGVDYEFN